MAMKLGGHGAMSDINVTPFVDICLVLLIIFMVVTPMLQEGIQINLPFAKNTQKQDQDEAVAIPAVWMFNYFQGQVEFFGIEMANSSSELIDFFLKRQGQGASSGDAARG